MVRTISTKFAVEGEAAYKTAITNINSNLRNLNSELALVTSEFKGNANSLEALKAKSEALNNVYTAQKGKVKELSDALENAKDSANNYGEKHVELAQKLQTNKAAMDALNKSSDYSAEAMTKLVEENKTLNKQLSENDKKFDVSTKSAQEWQTKINGAQTEVNKLSGELKKNEDAIKKFDKAQADAIYSSQAFKDMQSKLESGFKALTIGIAAAVVGFGALIAKSIESADSIQKNADVYGITAERVQELTYAGSQLDVELDVMLNAQTKLTKAMSAAKDGTAAQSEAFKQLGISVVDSNGELRDSQTVLAETIDALGGMKNETERDALALKVLGKSAMELNPLIKAGGSELARLSEEARANGAVMSNEAVAGLDKFGDTVDGLKVQLQGVIGTGITPLIPKLQDFADRIKEINMQPLINGIGWVIDHGEGIIAAITGVAAVFVTYKAIVVATTAAHEIHNAILIASALAHGGLAAASTALTTATGAKTLATAMASGAAIANTAAIAAATIAHGAEAVALGVTTAAQWALNVAMDANPIGIVILAIAGIVTGLTALIVTLNDTTGAAEKTWEALGIIDSRTQVPLPKTKFAERYQSEIKSGERKAPGIADDAENILDAQLEDTEDYYAETMELEKKLYEKEIENNQKILDAKKDKFNELKTLYENNYNAAVEKIEAESDQRIASIEEISKYAKAAHEEKMAMYEKEYLASVGKLDKSTNAKVKSYQSEIDAIKNLGSVEAAETKRRLEENKLTELSQAVLSAKTAAEALAARKEYHEEKVRQDKEANEIKRASDIAALNQKISDVVEKAKEEKAKLEEIYKEKIAIEKAEILKHEEWKEKLIERETDAKEAALQKESDYLDRWVKTSYTPIMNEKLKVAAWLESERHAQVMRNLELEQKAASLGSMNSTGVSGAAYVSHNASGTDNFGGGLTWVGERGPELMRLPRGTQIFSNEKSQSMVGGDTINVIIDAKNVQEFNDIVRIAKGAKQSYRMGVV